MRHRAKRAGLAARSAGLVGAAAAILALTCATSGAQELRDPPASAAGPGADDWRLRGLDGSLVSLQLWHGRVIFLWRWSTFCGPCVADLPGIQALHDSTSAEGVVFLAVSYEEPRTLKSFVRYRGFQVPVYSAAGPEPDVFRSKDLPAVFIIGPGGEVAFSHQGRGNWGAPAIRDYLRSLLRPVAAGAPADSDASTAGHSPADPVRPPVEP